MHTEDTLNMAIITISNPAPNIGPGNYMVKLFDISDPKTITPRSGPSAGQEVDVRDWDFAIVLDDGTDGPHIRATTSMATGPLSKAYAFLAALLGRQPKDGEEFELHDLVGLEAIATIGLSDSGYPRIETLGPLPPSFRKMRPM
jgi:hypothetical protein